jgi:hypothetical protein
MGFVFCHKAKGFETRSRREANRHEAIPDNAL